MPQWRKPRAVTTMVPTGAMTDEARNNPANALTFAYNTHYSALIDSVAPILGCRFRAQDVVQDAWVRLAEHPPAGTIRQPASYLFRLVRNLAIDRARRLALEVRFGAREEVPLFAPGAEPTPEQSAISRDLLNILSKALDELPARSREIFEMHRISGHSVDEIAGRLGISLGYVYRILRQVTVHCAKRLGPDFPDGRG